MKEKKESPKSLEDCCSKPLEWKEYQNIDYKYKQARCDKCNKGYEQNLLTQQIYVFEKGKNQAIHLNCGEGIIGVKVAHPIWERGMMGGYGECEYESVPYCPKCEEEPSSHGSPLYYGPIKVDRLERIDALESMRIIR